MCLQLQELWLDRNDLTGTLPSSWDQFTSVRALCFYKHICTTWMLQAGLYMYTGCQQLLIYILRKAFFAMSWRLR